MDRIVFEDVVTAMRAMHAPCEMGSADEAALEPFDDDAMAGDWFEPASDPHYARLPCYVSLDDEDDGCWPFADDEAS